jgi:hypothetical protein
MEVELRGRTHAVEVVPEVDLIQVHLEDPVLRILLLDPHRERDL